MNGGSPAAATNSIEYARTALELSVHPNAPSIRQSLKDLLTDTGYVSHSGRLNLSELKSDFDSFFSGGFEDARLTHLLTKTCVPEMVVRALAREERAIHPVYVVLMRWFLHSSQGVRRPTPTLAEQRQKKRRAEQNYIGRAIQGTEQIEEKRKAWLRHLSKCVGMTRTQARLLEPGLWTWLYRNDRAWLEQHQASKKQMAKPKKAATPPTFLGSIFSQHQEANDGHPNHLPPLDSAYQARLRFGLSDYQLERLCESIAGVGKLAQRPAAKQCFVSKRIDWALKHLSQRGTPVNEFTVARASRLRLSTIRRHLDESVPNSLFYRKS